MSDTIGRLADYLIDGDLRADALRLAAELERLERLLHVSRQLRDATDDSSLRLAAERVLEDTGQLAVSEVDVVIVL